MSWFKKEGTQLMLRETGQPARLFIVEHFGFSHYPNGDMVRFIDAIADHGGNGVRVFGFFPFGKGREEEPYVRSGGKFDLSRFNDRFFTYLQQWVDSAYRRGVAVLYELFDSVGLKYAQLSPYHPFGEFNQGRQELFCDLSNAALVRYQKAYLEKVVDFLKNYPNVIFGVMNECKGGQDWHAEMSRHIKRLAPNHLISGSDDNSPAAGDPHVDMWAIHTGNYDFRNCRPDLRRDIAALRPRCGQKIIAYSTDGFGSKGVACEKPAAMQVLAKEILNNGLQVFRYLDTQAYVGKDDAGNTYPPGEWLKRQEAYETSDISRLNRDTYAAISAAFAPTPLPTQKPVELPEGFLHVCKAINLASSHPDVRVEKGGKAVAATVTQGYLCQTQPVANLPVKPLAVGVTVFIDNNTFDDALILILDVYDVVQKKVLTNWAVTRKQFPQANTFNLLKLSFTPPASSRVEFRVYYFGYAYVVIDKIAIVDPSKITLNKPADIPDIPGQENPPTPTPPPPPPTPPTPPTPSDPKGIIERFDVVNLASNHPEAFLDKGGRAVRATRQAGFLAFGQYATNYPVKKLAVYFSVFIDNNTADNNTIISLDVYDSFQKKLLAQSPIRRQSFPVAGAWSLFKLEFTPVQASKLEFRVYYHGWSYIAADKIAVVDPEKIQFADHAAFLAALQAGQTPGPTPSEPPINDGNTMLLISSFTPEIVQQAGGQNRGGDFSNGAYTPSNRGGIEFVCDFDTNRKIIIEFEIEGNIANPEKREQEGGKVSLFDLKEQSGGYYAGLQRMSSEYRGGGKMRATLTNNFGEKEGAGFAISWKDSTLNWGNEAHRMKVILHAHTVEMIIDDKSWGNARAKHAISGKKRVALMIGNRVDRPSAQHAITRFKWFKVSYA